MFTRLISVATLDLRGGRRGVLPVPVAAVAPPPTTNVVFRNATALRRHRQAGREGRPAIKGDRIVAVGKFGRSKARR